MSTSPEQQPSPPQPISVLVVDADSRVRSAFRAALSSEPDLEVLATVPAPAAALALVGEPRRTVALVDVQPTGERALDLVRLLSRRPGWRVVAMSVQSNAQVAARAAGAVSFVVKGEDVDAVLSAVRAAAFGP